MDAGRLRTARLGFQCGTRRKSDAALEVAASAGSPATNRCRFRTSHGCGIRSSRRRERSVACSSMHARIRLAYDCCPGDAIRPPRRRRPRRPRPRPSRGAGALRHHRGCGVAGHLGTGPPRRARSRSGSPRRALPTPSCVVRPELTEGPYFVDERLNRSDIRSDPDTGVVRPGIAAHADLRRVAHRRQHLRPVRGRARRPLALRRASASTPTCSDAGFDTRRPEVPARLPGDRRRRHRALRHHLPRLVPGPHRPHALQDPHRSGLRPPGSSSPRSSSSTTR